MHSNATFVIVRLKTKLARNAHVKQHSIDGVYTCEKCDKAFGSASRLKAHIANNENRIFKCGYCRTGFCHQDNLVEHMQSHEQNVFYCTHCEGTFTSKTALESHLEIHKDSLLYKCDSCELSFVLKKLWTDTSASMILTNRYIDVHSAIQRSPRSL